MLGIQGEALLPSKQRNFLREAVSCVQHADDRVGLHLQHVYLNGLHPQAGSGQSLLDMMAESLDTSMSEESSLHFGVTSTGRSRHRVHPFVMTLPNA